MISLNQMKKILIFLGPPGSGKGTQAKKIAAKYGYAHISTGDLLRSLAADANAAPDEKEALVAMKHGKLVPDWLIYRLGFKAIEKNIEVGSGVVLDGAIRNVAQAQEYQKFFKEKNVQDEVLALEIAINDDESLKRLSSRRVCSTCGEIIPAGMDTFTQCPKCGGKLVTRADDSVEVVRGRIEIQGNKAIEPVREFYQSLGELTVIDGMQPIEKVEKEIEKLLRNY